MSTSANQPKTSTDKKIEGCVGIGCISLILLFFASIMVATCESGSSSTSDKYSSESESKRFEDWAIANTAVTDISIRGASMFVTLTPDKYTSEENVSQIARELARWYCIRTGSNYMNCHVYRDGVEYASGSYTVR